MQVFLKKIFQKDIVAIIQNIVGLVINSIRLIWLYKIVPWFTAVNTWFKTQIENLEIELEKIIFRDHLRTPIIIYQPGKVGSITVHESLKAAFERLNLATPIYHAHNLNRIEVIEETIKQARKNPGLSLKKLGESKELRQQIDEDPSQKWSIISLVRDPVALRVSTMFQVLDEYIPDWAELTKENKLSIQDLQDLLISRKEFDPAYLAGWFDRQVKELFDFDIFSTPFDVKRGFKIYHKPFNRFSFLIIRLEDLNSVAPVAFNKFIRLKKFHVINQNIGEEKPYSALYKQFKSTALPAEYLDAAYKTQYARHFYAPDELENFRNRWLHPEIKKEK